MKFLQTIQIVALFTALNLITCIKVSADVKLVDEGISDDSETLPDLSTISDNSDFEVLLIDSETGDVTFRNPRRFSDLDLDLQPEPVPDISDLSPLRFPTDSAHSPAHSPRDTPPRASEFHRESHHMPENLSPPRILSDDFTTGCSTFTACQNLYTFGNVNSEMSSFDPDCDQFQGSNSYFDHYHGDGPNYYLHCMRKRKVHPRFQKNAKSVLGVVGGTNLPRTLESVLSKGFWNSFEDAFLTFC